MNKKVYNIFLALSIIVLFSSCNNTELGNIEVLEQNSTESFKKMRLYLKNFDKLNLEADIILRNKVSKEDSILFKNIIENETNNKDLVIKDIDFKTFIWNQIFIDIKGLTILKISEINSSEFVLVSADEKNNKIDLYLAFRISQPEFNVGHKNDYSY